MHIDVPPDIAAWLARRIAALGSGATPDQAWIAEMVRSHNALPLYHGWFDTIGLRADGEIIQWSSEGEYAGTKPVEDRCIFLNSLADAARQYPELQRLLPSRPAGAKDCRHLSIPIMVEKKLFCNWCCGLGWEIADAADDEKTNRGVP